MATTLWSELAAGSSPTVYYTISYDISSRSATSVGVNVYISAHMGSGSYFGTGYTLTGYASINGYGAGSTTIKASSTTWSGTTVYSSSLWCAADVAGTDTSASLHFWTTREAGGGTTGKTDVTGTIYFDAATPGSLPWVGYNGSQNDSSHPMNPHVRSSIVLSWGASSGATGYVIQKKNWVNSAWADYGSSFDVGNVTSYTWDTSNDPINEYWWNIYAYNSAGNTGWTGPWNGFNRDPARMPFNNGSAWQWSDDTVSNTGVYVNDGGVWKPARSIWINDNGTWKRSCV